ncbi:MAG: hypothetical protein ABIH36_03260 [bacterium]
MFDLTTLWAWLQKNKRHAGKLILALLIFAVGWQLGKVMSPYYASHPIIFQDRPCVEGASSSGGSQVELQALQEQGRGEPPSTSAESAGETPAAAAGKTPEPAGKTLGVNEETPRVEEAGAFVGSVNSNLYHHKDCSSASRIKEENKIWFATTEEAEAAGYSPSKCTRDKLGI